MDLVADNLDAGYGRQRVLDGLSLSLDAGTLTGIIGPNGCGKSTLLKVLARLMTPWNGSVRLDGEEVHALGRRQLAKRLAVLPQSPLAPPQITVAELVSCGRHPHVPRFGRMSREDRRIVAEAMSDCELDELAERPLDTLSGGQRQRVWLAATLAQQPCVLLLDEPLAALDISHQLDALDLLGRLNRERGLTIAIVLHDINLAARYCSHLVLMDQGRIVQHDRPSVVCEGAALRAVFDVDVYVDDDPRTARPVCRFYRREGATSKRGTSQAVPSPLPLR